MSEGWLWTIWPIGPWHRAMTANCAKQTAGVGREAVIAGRDPEIACGTVSGRRLAWPGGQNSARGQNSRQLAARPQPRRVRFLTSPVGRRKAILKWEQKAWVRSTAMLLRHAPGGTPKNFLKARLKAASDS